MKNQKNHKTFNSRIVNLVWEEIRTIRIQIGKNYWDLETCRNRWKLELIQGKKEGFFGQSRNLKLWRIKKKNHKTSKPKSVIVNLVCLIVHYLMQNSVHGHTTILTLITTSHLRLRSEEKYYLCRLSNSLSSWKKEAKS